MGLVTPLAVSAARSWEKLLAGATATVQLEEHHVPPGHWEAAQALPSQVVAPVNSGELETARRAVCSGNLVVALEPCSTLSAAWIYQSVLACTYAAMACTEVMMLPCLNCRIAFATCTLRLCAMRQFAP